MRVFSPLDERNLSLFEHLDELRGRLIRCTIAIVLGFCIGYALSAQTIDLLLRPIKESGLVPRHELTAEVDIGADGTWRFRRLYQTDSANNGLSSADAPTTWSTVTNSTSISRIEFYLPNQPQIAAVLESSNRAGVVYIRPMDPFLIRLKAALIVGLLLALPVILHQVYGFLAPGLYPEERRAIVPMLFGALALFPIGAAFAYYLLKFALFFFANFAAEEAYMFNDIRAYMSLALTTMLAFGILFELPIAVLLLTRLGIVSVETLAAKRKLVFVILLIVCAVATPTGDPITLAAMAFPLYGLFEFSLLIGRITQKKQEQSAESNRNDIL